MKKYVIKIDEETHLQIVKIKEKTGMRMEYIVFKLLGYALKRFKDVFGFDL
ncbi:MAG: hypothetical protein GY804_00545 [Alphaproteobacteria bacterium]|nr:hypothetical protein [Alphaproteobacteria bacterium]